jgi:hypothetical protein
LSINQHPHSFTSAPSSDGSGCAACTIHRNTTSNQNPISLAI